MQMMPRRLIRLTLALSAAALVLAACGFATDERLDGRYRLVAVDVNEDMSVCYSLENGSCIGRISETVFAVGWNNSFIVAARHPKNDRSRVEYFYIDRAIDGELVDPSIAVNGPFDSDAFEQEKRRHALPAFRREIASLK